MDVLSIIADIGWFPAICLVVGLGLVIIEMFAPGFGASGVTGIILLILGVVMTADTVTEALIMIIVIIVILCIALAIVLRSATKGRLSRSPLILSDTAKKESGYISTKDLEGYLGKEGTALTVLRPAGTADFDGVKLDVVSEGEFIPAGSKVKIMEVAGRRVVVGRVSAEEDRNE